MRRVPASHNAGRLMPLYRNPDFLRLPSGIAGIFDDAARDSFFALPGWYDLMARHGVPPASEIRLYSDERPGTSAALALRVVEGRLGRRLASLANAYSVEHGMVCARRRPTSAAAIGTIAGASARRISALGRDRARRARSARAVLSRRGCCAAPRRPPRRMHVPLRHLV